jgi:2'-5' RNA ligase
MNRQFIAVVPEGPQENPELKRLLGKLKRTVSDREMTARWVPPDLWHVTLAFLGDLGEKGPELRRWFDATEWSFTDLVLRLQGLGAFPEVEAARVLWIGIQENQALLNLQSRVAADLEKAGFAKSEREYNPHLTIARFRNPSHAGDLVGLGGRKHFGDYSIREVVLFESVLQNGIVKYSPVSRRPLASELPS